DGPSFFSEDALCWPDGNSLGLPPLSSLPFGSPSGLSSSEKDTTKRVLRDYIRATLDRKDVDHQQLGLDPRQDFEIPSFHPVMRVRSNGSLRMDMVVEVVQTTAAHFSPPYHELNPVPFRGGATLIFSTHGTSGGRSGDAFVRYVVAKSIRRNQEKIGLRQQEAHLLRTGLAEDQGPDPLRINFALLHRGY